jgi:regulator of RNase E activity RraA
MQQDEVTLAPDTLDRLHRVSTATLTTQLLKNHGLRTRAVPGVKPVDARRCSFVGPAYTVRYVPTSSQFSR